eukprot:5443355-Lingulodinium_polyedra.AAC.1
MAHAGWASQLAPAKPSGRHEANAAGGAGMLWKIHLAVQNQTMKTGHRTPTAQHFTGHKWST